jgi:hypothetical protein
MKCVFLATAALTASIGTASAGGYGGLGIGTSPATTGVINYTEEGRSGRLLLGYSFGRLSVEGSGTRYGLVQEGGRVYDGTQLAVMGKFNHPLGDGFEVFGRIGMQRTSIDESSSSNTFADATGSGLALGVGAEYRLKVSFVASASLFVDYSFANTTLEGPSHHSVGMTTRLWTIGFTVGI